MPGKVDSPLAFLFNLDISPALMYDGDRAQPYEFTGNISARTTFRLLIFPS
jgi:hypothetical protein